MRLVTGPGAFGARSGPFDGRPAPRSAGAGTAVRHLLPPRSIQEAEEPGRTGPLVLEPPAAR
ncbi:hypothetical protein ACWGE1_34040 [Streptomyces sp. NPDC054932]